MYFLMLNWLKCEILLNSNIQLYNCSLIQVSAHCQMLILVYDDKLTIIVDFCWIHFYTDMF